MLSKVFLLGDSLTEGAFATEQGCWGAQLYNHFLVSSTRRDVVNRGKWSYTSGQYLSEFDSILAEVKSCRDLGADVHCTILLGTNDAFYSVPLEEYKTNMTKIITSLQAHLRSNENIILISPPPIDVPKWNNQVPPGLPSEILPDGLSVSSYAEMSAQLARDNHCLFVDLFNEFNGTDLDPLFSDGIHFLKPTADKLFALLKKLFEKQSL